MKLKTCTKCGETKPVGPGGEFSKTGKLVDGSTKWRPWCKPCCAESQRKWKQENPEKVRKWKQENPEKVRKYARKYARKRHNNLPEANKIARGSISRALKRRGDRTIEETLGGYTRAEAVAFTIPFAEERLRLETETGEAYHIHHKRSISIGGTHTPDNLCVITERENVAMGNCWFLEDDLTDEDIERLDREALEFTP